MGWRVVQSNVVLPPPAACWSSRTPLLATIRGSGTVTCRDTESALSVFTSLQGHHQWAPKGSLRVQIRGCPP